MRNKHESARIISSDHKRAINKILKPYRLNILYSNNRRVMVRFMETRRSHHGPWQVKSEMVAIANDWNLFNVLSDPSKLRPDNQGSDGWCYDAGVKISKTDLKTIGDHLMLSKLSM